MTELRGGRRVLGGVIWGYGAQFLTVIFQFGYAAVVSRLAGSSEFGAYGVALSVTGLISLIANGGMSQAVARVVHLEEKVVGAMFSFSLFLGVVVAALTFLTAPLWADLWGVPAAREPIQWMSISALAAPTFSLLTGLARRSGNFSSLAKTTVISNVLGMAVGIFAVSVLPTASSLLVSAVIAQLFLVLWLAVTYRRYLRPRAFVTALPHVAFSSKLAAAGVLQYAVGNLGKWSVTRMFGAPVLGQWNRAEVLTIIPMQQVQNAMVQAVYPEFRHDIAGSTRAKTTWADMLLLVAWFSGPAGVALAVFAPHIIPWVLGPAWTQAALFAWPLAIGVSIQPISVLLASALESLGSFRRIWATDVVLLVLQIVLVILLIIFRDVLIVIWGLAITNATRFVIHSSIAAKIDYLDLRKLCQGLFQVAAGCLVVFILCRVAEEATIRVIDGADVGDVILSSGALILCTSLLALAIRSYWKRLPPVQLALKYGIIRK